MEKGMSFVTFTDHDTLEAYDEIGWSREFIVTGVEIKIRDEDRVGHTIHINVFDLSRRQFSDLQEIAVGAKNLELFIEYLTSEDLFYSYNHPFWFEPGDTPNFKIIPTLFRLFPVVEYNMQRVQRKNRLTLELAAKHGNGVLSTTDSHTGEIAKAFTVARGDTFQEFFSNVTEGDFFLVAQDLTVKVMTQQMVCWLDTLFKPEDALEGKVLKTGNVQLDRFLNSVLSGEFDERPFSYRIARSLTWAASRSRIPSFLYLRAEENFAKLVDQQLKTISA
jgi:predicted metal-dependent phosphoesterase TrpH